MASESHAEKSSAALIRIGKALDFIHDNLDSALSLDEIAQQSCWSRWQLQRVFQHQTGTTVAQYVRELKLSEAAERLLDGQQRIIDIALSLGFNSEISFSRAFKQMFNLSPRAYRQTGQRTGLRKPIQRPTLPEHERHQVPLVDVRVESRPSFQLTGVHDSIHGLFSTTPDFAEKVPALWQQLEQKLQPLSAASCPKLGVIDVTHAPSEGGQLTYWAGLASNTLTAEGLSICTVPAQTYAVLRHRGPIDRLPVTLHWFIVHWLPESGYRGIDGFELESYPPGYAADQHDAVMEYWLPIIRMCASPLR